jgi:hypothetical protein
MMAPRCRPGTTVSLVTIKSVAHGVCFGHPLRETLMVRYPHALLGYDPDTAETCRQTHTGWSTVCGQEIIALAL